MGIPFYELPFTVAPRPLYRLPGHLWQMARKFRPFHFSLWHSYHYLDDYTEPLIAYASGARAWVYTKKNMGWGSRAWKIRTLLAARVAATNSAMLERFFTAPRTRQKVRLIPTGVDSELFQPGIPPRLGLRQRLGLGQETLMVGCVANLIPIKGHPTLIRAVARVPNAALLLAGKPLDQTYVDGLRELCASLQVQDRVYFLDDVRDIPAFDAELDIFVLPSISRGEGGSVALLEAMACGVACIATDVPGSQDMIEQGVSGLLVPPEQDQPMAQAIRALTATPDLRAQMGKAARARVVEKYSLEGEARALETLYTELLRL